MNGPWKFGDVVQTFAPRVARESKEAVVIDTGSPVSGDGNVYRYRVLFVRDGAPWGAFNIYTNEADKRGQKNEAEVYELLDAYRKLEAVRWANGVMP